MDAQSEEDQPHKHQTRCEKSYSPQTLAFDGFSGGLGSGFSSDYKSLAASSGLVAGSPSSGIASLGLGMRALGTMDSDSIFQMSSNMSSGLGIPPAALDCGPSATGLLPSEPLRTLQAPALSTGMDSAWPQPFGSQASKDGNLVRSEYANARSEASPAASVSSAAPTARGLPTTPKRSFPSAAAASEDDKRGEQPLIQAVGRVHSAKSPCSSSDAKASTVVGSHSKHPPAQHTHSSPAQRNVPRQHEQTKHIAPNGTSRATLGGLHSAAAGSQPVGKPAEVAPTTRPEQGEKAWNKASELVRSSARTSSACARRARGMWRALQFARMYDVLWHCALVLCLLPVSLAWSLLTFVRSSNVPTAATPQASIWAARRAFMSQVAVVVYLVHLLLHCSQQTRDWLAQAAHSNARQLAVDWEPQQLLGVDRLHLPAAGFSPLEHVQRGLSLLGDALPLQAALLSGAIVWDHATHTWLSYRPLQRELVNLFLSSVCVGCCCLYSRSAWLSGVALPMLLVSALRSGRLVDKPRAAATQTPVTLSSLELLAIASVYFSCWGAG